MTNSFSLVAVLLGLSCPAAIPWFVVLIVVYSIKRVFSTWRSAHISKEGGKALLPVRTHCDSSPSPIGISLAGFIEAPLFRVTPSLVFLAFFLAVFLERIGLSMGFATEAPAAFGNPRSQGASKHQTFIAAIAATKPSNENAAVRPLSSYDEFPEASSGEVLFSHASL